MSPRQLVILFALALPLVTVFDLPSALKAMVKDLTEEAQEDVPDSGSPELAAVESDQNGSQQIDRVALLSTELVDSMSGDRRSDSFPDVALIDHHGRTLKFKSDLVRDKICCIVFFYTNCEGTCPGTLQRVAQLRRSLRDEFAAEQLQFVAITLNPELDNPQRLKEYAATLLSDSTEGLADWRFCTGDTESIELVRRSLGLYELDPELDADRSQHAAIITFGNDRTDRWTALPAGITFNDFAETFLRIAGTSEQQRFASRIARSARINELESYKSDAEPSSNHCAKEICSLPENSGVRP